MIGSLISALMGASQSLVLRGGVVTTDGTYTYHTFINSGALELLTSRPVEVEYLVVGAGGGGSAGTSAVVYPVPGGGAEVLTGSLVLVASMDIVAVGSGGLGGLSSGVRGQDGTDTVVAHAGTTLTARAGKGAPANGARAGASGNGNLGGTRNATASGGAGSHVAAGANAASASIGANGIAGLLVWGTRYSSTYGSGSSTAPNGHTAGAGAGVPNTGYGGSAGSVNARLGGDGVVVIRYLTIQ